MVSREKNDIISHPGLQCLFLSGRTGATAGISVPPQLNTGLEKKHIPVTVIKEGVIESGPSRITISGNIVTLNLNLWKESGWVIEPKDEIKEKIPKEYAPEAEIVDICILGKSSYEVNGIGYFYINNEGNMHISNKLNLSSVRMARVNLSYEI